MAQRHATRRYTDVLAFLRDWQEQLAMDALLFPVGELKESPAAEMKVDIVLPGGARVGPIVAQLVNQFGDGSCAFRVTDMPVQVAEAANAAEAEKDRWKQFLLDTGEVSPPSAAPAPVVVPASSELTQERDTLRERVRRLEADLVRARAASAQAASSRGPSAEPVAGARGLVVPEVGHLPVTAKGPLGDKSLRDLFMQLAVKKQTGLLTLTLPGERMRWGFIQKGGPVAFRAEPMVEQEVLGVLLYKAGTITKEQLAQSLTIMDERGMRQGEALIDMGVLTFSQLVLVLQKQVEFVLIQALAEPAGTWTFHALEEHTERFVAPPMRVAAYLFRDLRTKAKGMAAEDMAAFLRPRLESYLFIKPGVERTLEEMRLSVDESAFLKVVSGTSYRVREVPSVSTLSRGQTAIMLWCLTELGLIEFRTEAAAARGAEKIAGYLASRKATLDKGSYFDQLEAHWMCTSEDVEKAWKKFNQEFPADQPQKYGAAHEADVRRLIAAVRTAYDTLSNETKRREYRLTKIEKVMIEQSAIMLHQKGDMAMMKDSLAEAYDCFSKAVELMPNVGEYRGALERVKAARR